MDTTKLDTGLHYSRGSNKFDNAPAQHYAATFDEFENVVLADRSPTKHLTFICAPLQRGAHYQKPTEYPGVAHWRLKDHVEPRAFLPFDFDGFASVEKLAALLEHLKRYRGFAYTTASSTPEARQNSPGGNIPPTGFSHWAWITSGIPKR